MCLTFMHSFSQCLSHACVEPCTGNGPRPQVTYSLDLDPRKESVQENRRTDVFMGAKERGQSGEGLVSSGVRKVGPQ